MALLPPYAPCPTFCPDPTLTETRVTICAAARRERVVVLTRLGLVAFINLVSIPSYQTQVVVADGLAWGAAFWLLTGAESLLVTALGLQVGGQCWLMR